jgi:Transglutaminase-like superfamily
MGLPVFGFIILTTRLDPQPSQQVHGKNSTPTAEFDIADQRTSGPADQRIKVVPMIVCAVVTALATSLVWVSEAKRHTSQSPGAPAAPDKDSSSLSLIDSLLAPPADPADAEIALLNLACAPNRSGTSNAGTLNQGLRTLDQWAAAVADQTFKNLHRYQENPREFGSEAEWRMAMMVTVLGQDFKVRYDPALTSTAQQNASNQQFFSNPDSVFLTGCLNQSRVGTCASLPVLYVAIGQRLDYPMHLVAAKGHLFARWDDGKGTRVNLEAANAGGYVSHPDSHYRSWLSGTGV